MVNLRVSQRRFADAEAELEGMRDIAPANAPALGLAALIAMLRDQPRAAIGLYEAMGFVADGRRRDYYGRGHDALLMSLRLSGAPGEAGGLFEGGGA